MVVLLTQEFPGVSREDAEEVSKRVHSSLKERAGVKRGFGLRFHGGRAFAGHAELAPWLPLSPRRCLFVRAGWLGQGPGGARPASPAPEASLTRVPASR